MDETARRVPPLILSGRAAARHRSTPAVLASTLIVFSIGGCEPAAPSDSDPAIRTDSAGVLLVEYPRLPPIEASRIAIAAEPDLVLGEGGAFVGPDYEFFQIRGVSQLRDGTLVVANNGSHEIRFYGEDGRFLRSVGTFGDGPGEFRAVGPPWVNAGDTVVVWDSRARRLQHFSPDGAFVRSTSIVTAPFEPEFSAIYAQAVLEDGRVVVFIDSPWAPTEGPERQPLLVALHRIDDGQWDSVQVMPGPERVVLAVAGGGTAHPSYPFFAYPIAAGVGATMAVADAARFRVELLDPGGRLVSIISASVPEVPVTADVVEAQVEHLMAHAPGAAGGEGPERAEYEERMRRSVHAMHAPLLPEIRDIVVDADERIWVERYDVPARGPSRWEVFEPDGTWVGRVGMPEGFARDRNAWFASPAPYFSVASGRFAGVWTDPDTGVETVRVYRVIEPDS